MNPYLFVVAAALAAFPILFVFKFLLEKIKENPEDIGRQQTKLFIATALSEIIPIIMIVLGLANLEKANSIEALYLPGLVVFLILGFNAFFVFLQRSVGVPEEIKSRVTSFSLIALMLANAIPILSLVCLFMMMP